MSDNDEPEEENILDFADEEELKSLVSVYDKHDSITWERLREDYEDFRSVVWGKSIEIGAVSQVSDRQYSLADRDLITTHLSSDGNLESGTSESSKKDLPDIDLDSVEWTRRDKLAGAGAIVAMLGFAVNQIGDLIYGVLGLVLNPLNQMFPFFIVVLGIATLTSIWSVLVREKIVDVDVSEFREYLSEIRGEDDDGGLFGGTSEDMDEQTQTKMMQVQQSMMKAQIKPFGWIMIGTIPAVIWIISAVNGGGVGTVVFPLIGEQAWAGSVLGPIRTWVVWYASCSIVGNQVFKNLLGL